MFQKNVTFMHEFSKKKKKSSYRGRDGTPSHTPRSVASLPRIAPPPPLKNPGYANDRSETNCKHTKWTTP